MKTLRLILGDQLNYKHSWFSKKDYDVVYVMAEMRQETDYVKHHIQKIVGFFLSMRNFSQYLEKEGHKIIYLKINDANNPQNLEKIIHDCIEKTNAEHFQYQLPDEYRLDEQLKNICENLDIKSSVVDTDHFYTHREELASFFKGKKQLIMENFYRMMRKKHDIMVVGGQPEGGKWNYDQSNRKKWSGRPEVPSKLNWNQNVSGIVSEIEKVDISTFGSIDTEKFNWPTSREQSEELLNHFCRNLLIHFGDFQDALHTEEKFLFHSRLSFAMNTKMLSPKEVINSVLKHYYENSSQINISQVEGFIRQILGWREYMRGIYWKEMPNYKELNHLNNTNPLPDFFWTGNTKMNCLKHSIGQSLTESYAHHIQRLMIIGNYALLTQLNPDEVDRWYLGVYIDAIEWVEITNTRGMSQFADGGIVATKPYVSSANYINKMGNYCQGCHYSHTKKTGENSCPFNSLYWNFLDEKKDYFKNNQRMAMMLNLLNKKDKVELQQLKSRANDIISNPDKF
ncbi:MULTISPECIES: cryptochrome/photolyase family protein [unclassified Croceitalea]|uniref:cryptochrome/photolyase family protein n=1 Tax=unclassified Croceitalea TaxID=2632280 RepID=UPI0030D7227E